MRAGDRLSDEDLRIAEVQRLLADRRNVEQARETLLGAGLAESEADGLIRAARSRTRAAIRRYHLPRFIVATAALAGVIWLHLAVFGAKPTRATGVFAAAAFFASIQGLYSLIQLCWALGHEVPETV